MILLIIVLLPMTIAIMMVLAPYAIGMLIAVSVLVSVILYFEWVLMGIMIGCVGLVMYKFWENVFVGHNINITSILIKTLITILVVSVVLTIMVL